LHVSWARQPHGQPEQLGRPSVTSTTPATHRASPVGQSCFTAIADASDTGPSVDAQPRWQPAMDNAAHKIHNSAMSEERIETFEEFWPYYVREHSKKATRTIHFVGTTAAIALVGYAAIRRKVWPLFVAPLAGYGPAWFSHFFIEGNKPATFKYPRWSLQADFVMWSKIVRGTMDEEVARVMNDRESQKKASTDRTAHAPS